MQQNPLLHFVAFGMVFITTVLHSVVLGRVHVCKANLNLIAATATFLCLNLIWSRLLLLFFSSALRRILSANVFALYKFLFIIVIHVLG